MAGGCGEPNLSGSAGWQHVVRKSRTDGTNGRAGKIRPGRQKRGDERPVEIDGQGHHPAADRRCRSKRSKQRPNQ